MTVCNRCTVTFETFFCPSCGLAIPEAEDWVTDEELYGEWRDRIEYSREGERIRIHDEEVAKSLAAIGLEPTLTVDDVPAFVREIDLELSILEETKWGFYRELHDAKMAVLDAVESAS